MYAMAADEFWANRAEEFVSMAMADSENFGQFPRIDVQQLCRYSVTWHRASLPSIRVLDASRHLLTPAFMR